MKNEWELGGLVVWSRPSESLFPLSPGRSSPLHRIEQS